MRFFLAIALVSVSFGSLVAQEPKPIRNRKVKQAQREYQVEEMRLDWEHLQAVKKAKKAYREKLDAVMKEVLTAGKLDEANAIDALRKSLDTKPAKEAQPSKVVVLPAGQIPPALVGTKWINSSGVPLTISSTQVDWVNGRADAIYFKGNVFYISGGKMQVLDFKNGKHLNYRYEFTLELRKR